jgi:hypothetical protein
MSTTRITVFASAALMTVAATGIAQAQPQAPNTTFFVTSAPIGKGGDFGGLAGADEHCQKLAATIGAAQGKTWRAYLSTSAAGGATPVHARDRIGRGPWQNSNGTVIATSVDDLHSNNNKLNKENSLTERGTIVSGFGMQPNWHDVVTGSQGDGRAWPGNVNLTCNNWTSSGPVGATTVGHIDRLGGNMSNPFTPSWNSAHQSRGCSQADFIATGGNALIYCFAAQ